MAKKTQKIDDALLKVALGYQIAEVTEEYAEVDGALKLTKRKKTKKDVPPDLKAVQLLLEKGGTENFAQMSDEELEREKERLLQALTNALQTEKAGDVSQISEDASSIEGGNSVKKSVVKKTAVKRTVKKRAVKKTVSKKKE